MFSSGLSPNLFALNSTMVFAVRCVLFLPSMFDSMWEHSIVLFTWVFHLRVGHTTTTISFSATRSAFFSPFHRPPPRSFFFLGRVQHISFHQPNVFHYVERARSHSTNTVYTKCSSFNFYGLSKWSKWGQRKSTLKITKWNANTKVASPSFNTATATSCVRTLCGARVCVLCGAVCESWMAKLNGITQVSFHLFSVRMLRWAHGFVP